MIEKNLA